MNNSKFQQYKVLPSLDYRLDDYPYPIRDWKNKNEYPKKGELSSKEWAWEFLRRNKNYQYDQDRYINKGHFLEFEFEYPNAIPLERQKITIEDARALGFYFDEVAYLYNQINTNFAYRNVKQKDGITVPIKNAIWEKYGIFAQSNTLLHDPRLDLPEHNFFLKESSHLTYVPYVQSLSKKDQHSLEPIIPENVVFRLSADLSLNRQLAYVEKVLRQTIASLGLPEPKEAPRKINDESYVTYIRMLDALASYGLSKASRVKKQIAEEIVFGIAPRLTISRKSSRSAKLNDWRKAAFPLVEHGYLDLLAKNMR